MSKKRRANMQVKATRPFYARLEMKLPPADDNLSLFYYAITIKPDGSIRAEQLPQQSPDATEENSSVMVVHQSGIAIHCTWFPEKPAPETDARREGLLAVMDDIVSRLPPDVQNHFKDGYYGIGHAHDAKLTWNEDDGNG